MSLNSTYNTYFEVKVSDENNNEIIKRLHSEIAVKKYLEALPKMYEILSIKEITPYEFVQNYDIYDSYGTRLTTEFFTSYVKAKEYFDKKYSESNSCYIGEATPL